MLQNKFFILIMLFSFLSGAEFDYTRENHKLDGDTGLMCSQKGPGFLYNPATMYCYYCPTPCVSQVNPTKIPTVSLNTMDQINTNIKDTIETMNKINLLQKEKILSQASNQAKMEAINMKLSQQKHEAEKSVKLQCINADMQINELNTKISIIESKLLELSKKQ